MLVTHVCVRAACARVVVAALPTTTPTTTTTTTPPTTTTAAAAQQQHTHSYHNNNNNNHRPHPNHTTLWAGRCWRAGFFRRKGFSLRKVTSRRGGKKAFDKKVIQEKLRKFHLETRALQLSEHNDAVFGFTDPECVFNRDQVGLLVYCAFVDSGLLHYTDLATTRLFTLAVCVTVFLFKTALLIANI